ncbi:GcvT family protein [Facilibium subflavum]|uniref:GcvT family protein n=1 Tax=Facilibium subflavum TaxID=2219058 RepID=UPI000E64BE32|nr:FAD-dependent oxidoreductase [Facilibium subflavum]
MQRKVKALVVGGGVVGVSTLYHLTKRGWCDVALIEQHDLTQGSTWHAAGLLPLYQMSYSVGQLHKYSVDLYKRLEEETGQAVSFHKTGNLRIATTQGHLDEFRYYSGTANTLGVPYEMVTPKQVKRLWPFARVDDVLGGIYHPEDGHIAPADVTQALAKGARANGAEIYRQTQAHNFIQLDNGHWQVHTSNGDIVCEHLILATGFYARETAKKLGLDIPVVSVEHQYIVTDEVPELIKRYQEGLKELPVLRDADHSYYMREERQGLILGPYEIGAPAWAVDHVPDGFVQQLLEPDYERLEPYIEAAIKRVPMFGEAGVKDCVNGPIAYTPDGAPMVGPAFCLKNVWLNEGHSFGITAAGGAGKFLVDWIVDGQPSIDMSGVDPLRFGEYANKNYARIKNEEAYAHVFVTHYPLEERPAARPAKTAPCYDRLKAKGAVFGQQQGWERANWFALEKMQAEDKYSFRRTNFFEPVKQECLAVRNNVGIIDLTAFSKFEITGLDAHDFLDSLVANKLPQKNGRITLAHALLPSGGVDSEFTITKVKDNHYYLISGSAATQHDLDVLCRHKKPAQYVDIRNVSDDYGVLVLVGPDAREVLSKLTDTDLSNKAFPWLSAQSINLGVCPVYAMRVNFVGELGWELHHKLPYQNQIFDMLLDAGEAFDIRLFGTRALESLRIEKSYRFWNSDLTNEYTLLESDMGRFIDFDKDFPGKKALLAQKQQSIKTKLVTLQIDVDDRDAFGSEPIYATGGDEVVGRVTTGAYAHFLGKSMAIGYVPVDKADVGTMLEVELLKERFKAEVVEDSPYDPQNKRLRS